MDSRILTLLASLCLMMTSASAQTPATGVDSTRIAGQGGTDVVTAVVNLIRSNCIFSGDRLFLRRLAYVETKDGTLPGTYSNPAYDGGIWKVDRHMLEATQSCSGVIQSTCDLIRQHFGIDWTHVTWADMRKPLYSGLGATLYLLKQVGGNESLIPAALDQQAVFWTQYYHREGDRANFTLLANETTRFDCKRPLDIAFILDSSGSIANSDFQLSLDFVARVVDAMDVPDPVRIAALIFEDLAETKFNFNRYSTKNDVMQAIRAIVRSSGGTATDAALNTARTEIFTTANGARLGSTRVAVLLTDGQSNNPVYTSAAAALLRAAGVTVFAIGVGGYNLPELLSVASEPKCSHVYTLDDFSQMDSILYEIQKKTCEAHTTLTTGTVTCTKLEGCGSVFTEVNETQTTVVNVDCGIAEVYVSFTNPNPGPALYTQKYTATDGRPAYLTTETSQNGLPMYITVIGSRLPPDASGLSTCANYSTSISKETNNVALRCCRGTECHPCTTDELRKLVDRNVICGNYYEEFRNPCTPEAVGAGRLMFPYPYDLNRFIRCDFGGNPYVTLCPYRQTFNPATLTCGYSTPGTTVRVMLPGTYTNPCTAGHIQAQYLYFAFPDDRQKFIHCDLWGNAWLESCPTLQVWSQHDLVCVAADNHVSTVTSTPRPLANPCTPQAEAEGKSFFPYPCDHTRFIHCGAGGQYWVQFCPVDMYYDPAIYICVTGDPQPHGEGCS